MTSVPCPAGAKVQEGAGAIVVPGFVDIHAHWDGTASFYVRININIRNDALIILPTHRNTDLICAAFASDYFVQQSWEYVVNLAFGITTMHNPSADTV
jgi:hypothetical protein